MTAEGRKSPVHVHVDRETPVHVHLKKKKTKPGVPTAVEQRLRHRMSGTLGKSRGQRKAQKSRSPTFIPPPGKTSKRPMVFEGHTHQLQVSPPRGNALAMEDLSTSDEEGVQGKMRGYERKIDSLMSEVGTLRNERQLQRTLRTVERTSEQLNASRRLIDEQEDELMGYKQELKDTVRENEALRHSMEKLKDHVQISRSEVGKLADERSNLLKKLVEVEMDGKAASEQMMKLRDIVRKLKEDKRMSAADTALMTRQRELLTQKLDEFERTNKALRRMLKDIHFREEEHDHLKQQQEVLIKRLTQSDTSNERFQQELLERDKQIETLLDQVEADKDQAIAFEELKKTMETTRAHLQNQLRSKEMDNNRLSVQLRSLEDQVHNSKIEVEHVQGLLEAQREKGGREKEALKKAARVQKDRVAVKDGDIQALTERLNDKDLQLADLRRSENSQREDRESLETENKTLRIRNKELQDMMENTERMSQSNSELLQTKLSTRTQEINSLRSDNEQLQADIAALEERLHEEEQRALSKACTNDSVAAGLLNKLNLYEEFLLDYKTQVSQTREEIAGLTKKISHYKEQLRESRKKVGRAEDKVTGLTTKLADSEELLLDYKKKAIRADQEVASLSVRLDEAQELLWQYEQKSSCAQEELSQSRLAIQQHEKANEDWLAQIERYRREVDDSKSRLYETEKESQRAQQETALEAEKVKLKMTQRISELELLADVLKSTELRLQESQDKLRSYERRTSDQTKLIAELTQKVEMQTEQLEQARDKWRTSQDDGRTLQSKNEVLDRKLCDTDQQNRELIAVLSKKEENVYQQQQKIEDLRAENMRLAQQLESSLSEARRQVDSQKEKAQAKERAAQARITDLETQLSRATASAAQLKRAKDETERRYSSKLHDMRDRLDQANSTTRSMQNYVAFLKSSYANVFDELESPR